MLEQFESLIMGMFHNLFGVFLLSMVPILELRGAIPVGIAFLEEYEWWQIYIAAVLGNIVPVPFAVYFLRKIIGWMKTWKIFRGIAERLEARATKKSEKLTRGLKLGLFLFVAIPLPGTGAWTASLIASVLNMRIKDCFGPIAIGVVTAGLIMTVGSAFIKYIVGIF